MDISTILKLQSYITEELYDASVYDALSKISPSENSKRILSDLANDQKQYARIFQTIYSDSIGRSYNPVVPPPNINKPYKEMLQDQVLKEVKDYRKYEDDYINETQNDYLKQTYYKAKSESNVYAMSLLFLLTEGIENK